MANPVNTKAKKLSKTIEARMIGAIQSNDDGKIKSLMTEAEWLLGEEYLTPDEFNTITDIELMTEMLG